jgi:hypothetical protein
MPAPDTLKDQSETSREAAPPRESGTFEVSSERFEKILDEAANAEEQAIDQENATLGARLEAVGGKPEDTARLKKFDKAAADARRQLDEDLAAAKMPGLMTMAEQMSHVQAEFGGKPSKPLEKKAATAAPEAAGVNPPSVVAPKKIEVAAVAPKKPEAAAKPHEAGPSPAEKRAQMLKKLDAAERTLQAEYAQAMAQLNADLAKREFDTTENDQKLNNTIAALDKVRAMRKQIKEQGAADGARTDAMPAVAPTEAMPMTKLPAPEAFKPGSSDEVGSELPDLRAELGVKEITPKKTLPRTIADEPGPYQHGVGETTDEAAEAMPEDSDELVADLLAEAGVKEISDEPAVVPTKIEGLTLPALEKRREREAKKDVHEVKDGEITYLDEKAEDDEDFTLPEDLEQELDALLDKPEMKWKPLKELEAMENGAAKTDLLKDRLTPESLGREADFVREQVNLDTRIMAAMPVTERDKYLRGQALENALRLADLNRRLKELPDSPEQK